MIDPYVNVNKQHHLYKENVAPITVIMRQYYRNESSRGERYERQKLAMRERYKNDEEYRNKMKVEKKLNYYKNKAKNLEQQISAE